jgi:acrylyl-CoA reductase (NADPH)
VTGRGAIVRKWPLVPGIDLAGAVDAVGRRTLAHACAATRWNGAVATCGLAQDSDFPATVMPFILRGITLYGINCLFISNDRRAEARALLPEHMRADLLGRMTTEIALSDIVTKSVDLLEGRLRGRTVVDVNR